MVALIEKKIPEEVLVRVRVGLSKMTKPAEDIFSALDIEKKIKSPKSGELGPLKSAFQSQNDVYTVGCGDWGQNGQGTLMSIDNPSLIPVCCLSCID